MSEPTIEELQHTLTALIEKVSTLEAKVASLEAKQAIPEDHLVLIGAAVAAYFGHKAKVRAVRYSSQPRWAAASRDRIHDRSVPHSR